MKLRFNITFTILDEISRFKVQYNQQGKIYPKHVNISRIARFESSPDLKNSVAFVVLWSCIVEIVAQWCSRRWMDNEIQLNKPWGSSNQYLPWKEASMQQYGNGFTVVILCLQKLPKGWQVMKQSTRHELFWRFSEKTKMKKNERVWEKMNFRSRLVNSG